MSQSNFSGRDWFQHHLGFIETPQSILKNITVQHFEDHTEIISKQNGRKINCGKFSLRDMNSYNHIIDLIDSRPIQEGHFHIIHGHGTKSTQMELVDIIKHQNNEDFNGATFVAASNFNLLEYGGPQATAHNGISRYAVDTTQGPAFATATIGSTIYRTYLVEHKKITQTKNGLKNPNSNSNFFIDFEKEAKYTTVTGQLDYELNLLERTPIPVIHGKAILNSQITAIPNNELFENKELFDFTNEKYYEIAVIQNAEVTTDRISIYKKYFDSKPNQFVHQIFASSFDLGYLVQPVEKNIEIMKFILFFEYKMIILQAIENSISFPNRNGSNKLVLTLIGAGFFHNPIEIVCGAISDNIELIKKSGLDIFLVCFDDNIFKKTFPLLNDLVDKTNGSIIDTI